MTIKEMEQITGLERSTIRFYEKENLIRPTRNASNGYREYSEADIDTIKKVAYLRTLGISIEDIRKLSNKEADLYDVIKLQSQTLSQQLSELKNAKLICERMLSSNEKIEYENLNMELYITDVKDYWNKNSSTFKLDSVSFFYMWGGTIAWGIITVICLLVAMFSVRHLPAKIPIQWDGSIVTSSVDKKFIFAFPVSCIIIRFVLRPFIWRWLKINIIDSSYITNYITNYLCFLALSVEVFIIFYVEEIVKHVTVVLFVDTFVLIGLLFMAVYRTKQRKR